MTKGNMAQDSSGTLDFSYYSGKIKTNQKLRMKIVVTGDLHVGKTSFVKSFVTNGDSNKEARYNPVHSICTHELTVDNHVVRLNIWDTAGQEKYRSLTSSYYRGAHGGIIVFDVTQIKTFESVTLWYKDLEEYSSNSEHVSAVLVGTLCDSRTRAVPIERAKTLADHIGIPYVEVNLSNGEQIREAFERLVEIIIQKLQRYPKAFSVNQLPITRNPKPKASLCSC